MLTFIFRLIIPINFLAIEYKAIERLAGLSQEGQSTLNSRAQVYSVIDIQMFCIILISFIIIYYIWHCYLPFYKDILYIEIFIKTKKNINFQLRLFH